MVCFVDLSYFQVVVALENVQSTRSSFFAHETVLQLLQLEITVSYFPQAIHFEPPGCWLESCGSEYPIQIMPFFRLRRVKRV
jgi:hypothetical protein